MSSHARIVVVEDMELEAKLVQRALADHGYSDIVHVKDTNQTLTSIADGAPCVVLVDVELGTGPSGIEIVRKLRTHRGPYVYSIVMTSRGTASRVQDAFEAGADDFVTKPFQVEELVARVRAGERLVQLERTLAIRCNELEQTLRAVSPGAASEALARAAARTLATGTSPVEKLVDVLPWEKMRDVLRDGLDSLVGAKFESATTGDRAAAIVGEVSMSEATRQLELGVTVVVDGASTKRLGAFMLGDENDVEGACALVLEVANVLMGCLKTAYIPLEYRFTAGLPTQRGLPDVRAAYDAQLHRQRFAFVANDITIEIWVCATEKRNRKVKGASLKEGMVLVDDVRDERGMLLVRAGVRLTQTTAARLVSFVPNIEVTVS